MNARLELPAADAMTPAQSEVIAEAVSGPRGKIPTPMIAWVQHPELARRAQMLGELLRFDVTLERRLVELAILVCAQKWMSHPVWTSHANHARKAGLGDEIIGAIAAGRSPRFTDDREQLVFDVSAALLKRNRVPDALYNRAVAAFGERGTVELVSVLGYYCLVSLTANAFALGLPEAVASELGDPDFAKGEGP